MSCLRTITQSTGGKNSWLRNPVKIQVTAVCYLCAVLDPALRVNGNAASSVVEAIIREPLSTRKRVLLGSTGDSFGC